MRLGSDSAMAEEALRVVELEGLQAHGSPGRGGEGEDDPQVSGSPQHPQKGHGCRVLPSCGEQIRPGQLKEWLQISAPRDSGATRVTASSLDPPPPAPHYPRVPPRLSPDEAQTHFLLWKLLGSLHAGVVGLRLQVDVQHHAQALQLVGEELVAWFGPPQLLVLHVDLALHGLAEGSGGRRFGFLLCPPRPRSRSHGPDPNLTPTAPYDGYRTARNHPPNASGSPLHHCGLPECCRHCCWFAPLSS